MYSLSLGALITCAATYAGCHIRRRLQPRWELAWDSLIGSLRAVLRRCPTVLCGYMQLCPKESRATVSQMCWALPATLAQTQLLSIWPLWSGWSPGAEWHCHRCMTRRWSGGCSAAAWSGMHKHTHSPRGSQQCWVYDSTSFETSESTHQLIVNAFKTRTSVQLWPFRSLTPLDWNK